MTMKKLILQEASNVPTVKRKRNNPLGRERQTVLPSDSPGGSRGLQPLQPLKALKALEKSRRGPLWPFSVAKRPDRPPTPGITRGRPPPRGPLDVLPDAGLSPLLSLPMEWETRVRSSFVPLALRISEPCHPETRLGSSSRDLWKEAREKNVERIGRNAQSGGYSRRKILFYRRMRQVS